MNVSPAVLLWLGHTIEKREELSLTEIPVNPIQLLAESLESLSVAKYTIVATLAFLIYDMLLTYNWEVQYVWGSRWTFVRVLFTITRYFVPCVLICRAEIKVMAATGIFCYSTMMCVLLVRVWTIWGRRKRILAALLVVFASSQLPPAILIGNAIQQLEIIDNPLPGLITGCVSTSATGTFTHWAHLFISGLTYESTLFVLTLIQSWQLSRSGVVPILTLLTRDGAWYFLVAIGSVGLTAVGTSIPKTQTAALLSNFFIAATSCTCCRLLLRLRGFCAHNNVSAWSIDIAEERTTEISMQIHIPGQVGWSDDREALYSQPGTHFFEHRSSEDRGLA
ncbi:hypothetical protein BDV93DRAFT_276329 [Ceratobasidium sp. AG-I]|nr:hypothetical protein BDV93DRAFT_276329 [Ceratobasidium sp. AG-I]